MISVLIYYFFKKNLIWEAKTGINAQAIIINQLIKLKETSPRIFASAGILTNKIWRIAPKITE